MNTSILKEQQQRKIKTQPGFIAALDQSGGSTPKALHAYGIKEGAWSNDEEMFALVHQMRARIITSPAFTGDRILAAILFENTMDREIEGRSTADYLWSVKQVVPILKVDNGLATEKDGVQLMKPIDSRRVRSSADGARTLGVLAIRQPRIRQQTPHGSPSGGQVHPALTLRMAGMHGQVSTAGGGYGVTLCWRTHSSIAGICRATNSASARMRSRARSASVRPSEVS